MATNIITVICEGPHDVAFLRQILKASGFESNDACKIVDFPSPINYLLINQLRQSDFGALNLQTAKAGELPAATLIQGPNVIFLFSMGGDTRKDLRNRLVLNLIRSIPNEEEIITKEMLAKDSLLHAVYFFDADKKGVKKRLAEISLELQEVFSGIAANTLTENGQRIELIAKKFSLGAYIFSQDSTEEGNLEDILLPLMSLENESIFNGAGSYVDTHFDQGRAKGDGKKFDRQKAIIGAAGQLQKSGGGNTELIRETDYLSKEKILANAKCQEIIQFFKQFELTTP